MQQGDEIAYSSVVHQNKSAADTFLDLGGSLHALGDMDGIAQPFIYVIKDCHSLGVSFGEGKVLLVGDATTFFRSYIAFSTNQTAAFDWHSFFKIGEG